MSDYFTKVICGCAALINPDRVVPVSYTHLDVYKRQVTRIA